MLRLRRLAPALLPPLLSFLLLSSLPLRAQTADDANEGLCLSPDPRVPGNYELRFWGRSGRTYFLLQNDDLTKPWTYFPVVETGQDAVISYGFTNPAPLVFVNLRHLDQSLSDPFGMDSDGDGLTNQQEFDLRTDLFAPDTDHDGLPDAWEAARGLDPRDPSDVLTDPDNDGRSTALEFLENTDPQLADAAPPSSGPTPSAPGQPTVEELSPTAFRISWTASTGGTPMLGYLVERSIDNLTWTLIGFTSGSVTTYDDTTTLPGTAYAYRVKGVY